MLPSFLYRVYCAYPIYFIKYSTRWSCTHTQMGEAYLWENLAWTVLKPLLIGKNRVYVTKIFWLKVSYHIKSIINVMIDFEAIIDWYLSVRPSVNHWAPIAFLSISFFYTWQFYIVLFVFGDSLYFRCWTSLSTINPTPPQPICPSLVLG